MPYHAIVQLPGEPDREIPLPPGSTAMALPAVAVSAADAPGLLVQGSGGQVRVRGRRLRPGERWLLRPGEFARVGVARIGVGGDGPGTATQARAILLSALRGEQPDHGPSLAVLAGPDAGRRLRPSGGILGRGAGAELRLGDPSLSRRHARVRVEEQRVLIEDLGSKNGLWLAGHRIRTLHEIRPGDEIRAGRTVLALSVVPGVPPTVPGPGEAATRPRIALARAALAASVLAALVAAALAS